jgi:hypothetical protein
MPPPTFLAAPPFVPVNEAARAMPVPLIAALRVALSAEATAALVWVMTLA